MSLYSDYLKEREDLEVIESEIGFVTYKFREDQTVYIQDIYVKNKFRASGEASRLANQVLDLAKKRNIHVAVGSVDSRANGAVTSDKVLRAYGMRPYTIEGYVTYYCKEID